MVPNLSYEADKRILETSAIKLDREKNINQKVYTKHTDI
jgi:hypothetical protein